MKSIICTQSLLNNIFLVTHPSNNRGLCHPNVVNPRFYLKANLLKRSRLLGIHLHPVFVNGTDFFQPSLRINNQQFEPFDQNLYHPESCNSISDLSLHGDNKVVEEPSVNINDSLQSTQSDVATDGDLLQNRLVYAVKKDDPNHILDLARFPGYVYSEPIKRPCHGWIWIHGHDIQHLSITRNNGKAKRHWVCKICILIFITPTKT